MTATRGSRRLLLAVVVTLAAGIAGPARAGAPAESLVWTRYQSPHFNVYSSAPQRRTEDYIVRLERFREVLGTVMPSLQIDSPVDTTVFIFKDGATMGPFAPRYDGKPIVIDGLFEWTRDENFVLVNGSGTDDHMPVVYHEYMHYFTMRNLPPLPPWFSEGIAECYETFRTDGKTAELGRAKPEHILYLRQAPFMPLQQLLAVTSGSPDYNEGDRRSVFYAESWALVHYLLWDSQKRRPQVVQYLERLGSGETPEAAFTGAFDMTPQALEGELRRSLERGTYLKSVVTLKGPPLEASVRRFPVSKAEIQARLGDLTAHSPDERSNDAETFLNAALAAEPDNPVALRALALVRRSQERYDDARALLEKRLAADAHDGMAAWSLGELLMEHDEAMPRVRTLLLAAAGDRPDIPEIALAYGRSLLAGPPEPSKAELDRAVALLNTARDKLRYRADLLATQAVLLAMAGNLPAAESLVKRALPVLGDPQSLAWAQASLERVRTYRQQQEESEKNAAEAAAAAQAQAEGPADEPPPLVKGSGPQSTQSYNRDVESFNRGVLLANRRDYAGALAILEPLYAGTPFADIKDRIRPLLPDLRRRAAKK